MIVHRDRGSADLILEMLIDVPIQKTCHQSISLVRCVPGNIVLSSFIRLSLMDMSQRQCIDNSNTIDLRIASVKTKFSAEVFKLFDSE